MKRPRENERHAASLLRRGLLLEYATLGWNVAGGAIVLWSAVAARSVALFGFGLDSVIEIFASGVVVWQLTGAPEQRERRALRLIGAAFFLLAAYVLAQSLRSLLVRARPAPSILGVAWLAITVIAMLALAYGKHDTGTKMQNAVLATEARVTMIDAMLAFAVLVGLCLDAALNWWWADPLAGLVIVYYGFREGVHAWR